MKLIYVARGDHLQAVVVRGKGEKVNKTKGGKCDDLKRHTISYLIL